MTLFKLKVTIEASDLGTISQANQQIVLVRSLVAQAPGNVAWVVIPPAPSLTIEWENAFGLFASPSEVVDGNVIQVSSTLANARDRVCYDFQDSNTFSSPTPDPTLKTGQFRIFNKNAFNLTFGMLQDLSVQGIPQQESPINAAFVPTMNLVTFQPLDATTIYLSSAIQRGQITTVPPREVKTSDAGQSSVTSLATTLLFTAGNTDITVEYSASLGKFVISS